MKKLLGFIGGITVGLIIILFTATTAILDFIGKQCFNLFNDYPIVATFAAVSLVFLVVLYLTAQIMGSV